MTLTAAPAASSLLGLGSGFAGDLLQDGLRSRLDQVLGLLEARLGEHLFDDLDLLVAGRLGGSRRPRC